MIKSIVPVVLWFYFLGPKYDNKLNTIPSNGSEVDHNFLATSLVDFLEEDVCINFTSVSTSQKVWVEIGCFLAEEELAKTVQRMYGRRMHVSSQTAD